MLKKKKKNGKMVKSLEFRYLYSDEFLKKVFVMCTVALYIVVLHDNSLAETLVINNCNDK